MASEDTGEHKASEAEDRGEPGASEPVEPSAADESVLQALRALLRESPLEAARDYDGIKDNGRGVDQQISRFIERNHRFLSREQQTQIERDFNEANMLAQAARSGREGGKSDRPADEGLELQSLLHRRLIPLVETILTQRRQSKFAHGGIDQLPARGEGGGDEIREVYRHRVFEKLESSQEMERFQRARARYKQAADRKRPGDPSPVDPALAMEFNQASMGYYRAQRGWLVKFDVDVGGALGPGIDELTRQIDDLQKKYVQLTVMQHGQGAAAALDRSFGKAEVARLARSRRPSRIEGERPRGPRRRRSEPALPESMLRLRGGAKRKAESPVSASMMRSSPLPERPQLVRAHEVVRPAELDVEPLRTPSPEAARRGARPVPPSPARVLEVPEDEKEAPVIFRGVNLSQITTDSVNKIYRDRHDQLDYPDTVLSIKAYMEQEKFDWSAPLPAYVVDHQRLRGRSRQWEGKTMTQALNDHLSKKYKRQSSIDDLTLDKARALLGKGRPANRDPTPGAILSEIYKLWAAWRLKEAGVKSFPLTGLFTYRDPDPTPSPSPEASDEAPIMRQRPPRPIRWTIENIAHWDGGNPLAPVASLFANREFMSRIQHNAVPDASDQPDGSMYYWITLLEKVFQVSPDSMPAPNGDHSGPDRKNVFKMLRDQVLGMMLNFDSPDEFGLKMQQELSGEVPRSLDQAAGERHEVVRPEPRQRGKPAPKRPDALFSKPGAGVLHFPVGHTGQGPSPGAVVRGAVRHQYTIKARRHHPREATERRPVSALPEAPGR